MDKSKRKFPIVVDETTGFCAMGERVGNQNRNEGKIPVISCEGACIRGEIARLAANLVAKEGPYRRSCHGEMFTVPTSAIAGWMNEAEKVVVIDGCFLHCHDRILKNLIDADKISQFDALSIYNKYTDIFDIDDVPEEERKNVARQVAAKVLADMEKGKAAKEPVAACGCTGCSK
ncbi:MAG: putative zinc-binding protein [Syntrophales bacterium]